MRSENYIFGDPHDEMTFDRLLRLGDQRAARHLRGRYRLRRGRRKGTRSQAHQSGRRRAARRSASSRDQVRHVILTHMHWDHAGNYDLFPNARYHIQDTEMAYATGRCMCHQTLRIPFSERDVHAMVKKIFAYRVEFHDGTEEIAPGITVHLVGGHSKGLQCVRVKTKRGYVVVASDCCHLYSHIDEGRVFPITYSVGDTLEGYKTLQKLASSRQHIVPGHDPEVLKIYPAAKRLEGWVVRLDVEPKVWICRLRTWRGRRRGFRPTPIPRTPSCGARRCRAAKAAEHHARNAARARGDFRRHGADRDAGGEIGGKAIDAGGDRRIGDRARVRGRRRDRARCGSSPPAALPRSVAAVPDRPDRMDDVLGLQPVAAGDLGASRFRSRQACGIPPAAPARPRDEWRRPRRRRRAACGWRH